MKISVIIPVRNGAQTLGLCLSSLCNQTVKDQMEIIVLDSMSTDGSRDIALNYGTKIISIPEATFNHGLTRNIGVYHATGTLIYFTVQDAWVSSNDMLQKMAAHFGEEDIMAVTGHQAIPHEMDKNPFLWYRPISAPEVTQRMVTDTALFKNLPVNKQQSLVSWDNVVSMYRKSALIKQPFVQTAFAEDWIWSYQALLRGWKLLHDSSLVVYHYHHQTYQYVFNTHYAINYHFYKFFKYKPKYPSLIMPVIKATYHLMKHQQLSWKEKIYWIGHNIFAKLGNFFSTIIFLIRLNIGGEHSIEKGYNKYCKLIPQGKQKPKGN